MQQQQEANQTLMNSVLNMMQQLGAAVTAAVVKPKNLVDTRSLGKPKDFTGKGKEWPEWKLKTVSWLNATNTENGLNAEHWLTWAEIQSETIDESLLDLACGQGNFTETQVKEVQKFDENLKLLILSWMGGDAFLHIRNAVSGLDAWRLVNLRFSPRTAGTKRNILVRLLSIPGAKSHKDLEAQIHKVDELIRKYEEISQVKLQEDTKTAVLMNLAPDTVRNTFDLDGKDRDHKTLRDELVNWVQIRRERESG